MASGNIIADDAEQAIHFLKKAFGATENYRLTLSNGKVTHCELKIGNSILNLGGSVGLPRPKTASPAPQRSYNEPMIRYALFDTAAGWAAIAWSEAGLAAVHLPEHDANGARQGIQRRLPEAVESPVPAELVATLEGIRALLRGEKVSLSEAPLDLTRVPEFNAKVYALTRQIPAGETRTYGEIAIQLGDKLLARDVGAALGKNPWPIIIPCHRVTAAGGKVGGFSARGGERTKLRLLAIEGARVAAQGDLFGKR